MSFVYYRIGYIGASVLDRLLLHPNASSFEITVLLRSQEKAGKLLGLLKNTGGPKLTAEIGSNADLDKIRTLASKADVVFAISDCDNVPAAEAILLGAKDRFESTGRKPILIHTSGAAVFVDEAKGSKASDTVWVDTDVEQIESLADDQPHRRVDLIIVEADNQGYVNTHIIVPGIIFGIAQGRLVDVGFQNPYTMPFKRIAKHGIDRGQAISFGEGKNIWPFVHLDDVADVYTTLFDALFYPTSPSKEAPGHGRQGFYFVENGETSLYDVYKEIAKALSIRGIGNDKPKIISIDSVVRLV
jgi:nucleoside-diphosphate-sugar epimerase